MVVGGLLSAGWAADAAEQPSRALAYYEQAWTAGQSLPADSRTRVSAALYLGHATLDAGRARDAIPLLREAVAGREILDRPARGDGTDGTRAQALLGEALVRSGAEAEGRRLLADAVPALSDLLGADHPAAVRARTAAGG